MNEDGTTWIDFRKLREIELGIAKVSRLLAMNHDSTSNEFLRLVTSHFMIKNEHTSDHYRIVFV